MATTSPCGNCGTDTTSANTGGWQGKSLKRWLELVMTGFAGKSCQCRQTICNKCKSVKRYLASCVSHAKGRKNISGGFRLITFDLDFLAQKDLSSKGINRGPDVLLKLNNEAVLYQGGVRINPAHMTSARVCSHDEKARTTRLRYVQTDKERWTTYVDALEARLETTEQLLQNLSGRNNQLPDDEWWSRQTHFLKHQTDAAATSGHTSLAALYMQSMNTPAPAAACGHDLADIELVQPSSILPFTQIRDRFQGKSSETMLVTAAVQLREGYEETNIPWSSRRMHYWTFNPVQHRVPHVGPYVFPDPDLLSALVNLYFVHQNLYFPLLHRPTFERSITGGLHTRDTTFGAVVLLVCAIGSRFSDDVRVGPPGAEPLRRGWEFFDQLPFHLDHLFETPTIYDLQYYCLATSFLANSAPVACWTLIGIGIRLAQDVGAHRHRPGPHTVESELWKRAFWMLVCYDRQVSMALGRSCITPAQFDDIDAELLIECDDEFWENEDLSSTFVQPAGTPSLTTFFNCYLRLNNILAFGLKTLYSLNKTKKLLAYRDDAWEEHIVAEIDSALNGWIEGIPSHLCWDPNRRDNAFFDQSVLLYSSYYQVQMTIHRPFIPTIRQGEPTSLPSLAICTNAARSCSRVADVSRVRKNGMPAPVLISSVFTSGVVLLLNVWSGKRTGLPPHLNSAITDVHKCMATLRVCEKMWQSAGLFCDLLCELATIGQLPLPNDAPPPPPTTNVCTGEEDQDNAMPMQHPPANNISHPAHPGAVLAVDAALQCDPLPTYTVDLGRLPIFHQHIPLLPSPPTQSTSSWDPPQQAPPRSSDGLPNDDVDSSNGYNVVPPFTFASDTGLAANGMMSSDVMSMWEHAPTSFQVDDWGVYFSIMRELNQDMESAPQL
ncbi:fungal-specific transcription factor domain-containing protein [Mycena haematopus]|nr:fungal-specific transcription factor domain-containing protein [Mycena haematopus]